MLKACDSIMPRKPRNGAAVEYRPPMNIGFSADASRG